MAFYILLFLLVFIFIQDLFQRAVYWFLFPVLLVVGTWYKWDVLQGDMVVWNLLFIVFCLTMLTLYVSIKEKTLTPIWRGYFSWGDIFFLIAIAPILPFHLTLFYFTLGTILTLFVHTISLLKDKKEKTIPYAGYMALFLIPVLFLEPMLNQWIIERL